MSLAEESLSEMMFRRLVDQLPGLALMVVQEGGRLRLRYLSPAQDPFWNRVRQHLEQSPRAFLRLFDPEDRCRLRNWWKNLCRSHRVAEKVRLRDSQGGRHEVLALGFPLGKGQAGGKWFGILLQPPGNCADHRQAAEALAWEARVNAGVAEIYQAILEARPAEEFSRLVLTQARELTGSTQAVAAYRQNGELVFVGGKDEAQPPDLGTLWPQKRLEYAARWARSLATREVFLINDPCPDTPQGRGAGGHYRFLCAPAVFQDQLLGLIALATNQKDYSAREVEALKRLAALYALALKRQEVEDALKESEARFRSLVEATSDLVWETDAAGNLLYVSPNLKDLLGYAPEEVLGRPFLDLLEPREGERLRELLAPIWEARKPFVFVGKTIRHRQGKPLVLESSGVPVFDRRGVFLGYRGVDRDITERHRTQEALFAEKERYRVLVEESPLGVAIISEDGIYKYVNPKFTELFGYTLEEVPNGREWFLRAFPDPHYRREVIRTWIKDRQDPQDSVRLRTYTVTCKDGSQKIINFRHVRLSNRDHFITYEDITEHHRAVAALQESEAKYRLLVSNIPAVVFRGYADWSVEFFDDKVEELTGYPREDFNSGRLKWCDLVFPEDLPVCRRAILQALKGPGAYIREYRIRHRKGHTLWIQSRGQIVRDAYGRIDHIYGVFYDITRQKEIEEALRESEENLKTLLHTIRAGVLLIDLETRRIVDLNHYAAEMLGVAKESVLGRECRGLICPLEGDCCLEILSGRVPGEMEHTLLTREGQLKPILKTATIFRRGGRSYLLESFLDLSEQKKVEQDLAAEKERLRVTLRSIGEGVIATDREGRVVLMNQMAELLTGWSQEEARGQPVARVLNLVHEATRKPCDNRVARVLRTGRVHSLPAHTLLLSRDGRERLLTASAAPIIERHGQASGVVLVFQDITLKRQTEAELQKMEKLTSLGVLAGGIAHDFNNILTGILGNISLAMLSLPQGGEALRCLREAEQASLRARDLVQQLLTFAKGGAPVKEVTSLEQVIRESATFACRGSQVRCDFSFPGDLWAAEVDPGQISQVIQNLVINAIQAMPTGGAITIRAENVMLQDGQGLPLPSGRYVKISVKDQGIGIPPDHLPRIFDPYFSTKQKGSGLGLATAYSIVKNHDGYITVDSSLGVGSTFTVYLPATGKKATLAPKPPGPLPQPGQGRILLMDDDAGVRQVAGRILERLGYEVEFAEDGSEAIDKYVAARQAGRPFDLVVMDLTIPGGLGGKEALQALRRIDPHIRAIVSSGYADDPILTRYQEYGFSGVIKKPYKVETFSHIVQQVLRDSPS